MPTDLQRYYGNGHLHFLTCSCYHRQRWLASACRRDRFLHILEEARQRYRFVVAGGPPLRFVQRWGEMLTNVLS